MLSSIHPLGEAGRGNRYRTTAGAFFVASLLGGGFTGAVFGVGGAVAGRMVPDSVEVEPRVMLAAVAALWLTAAVLARFGRRLPSLPRQVNENWLVDYRGWVYGAGFGFQLGTGVMTWIRSSALWAWLSGLLALGAMGSPFWAVAVGAVFGMVRGASIITTRGIHTPMQLIEFHRHLHEKARCWPFRSIPTTGSTGRVPARSEL